MRDLSLFDQHKPNKPDLNHSEIRRKFDRLEREIELKNKKQIVLSNANRKIVFTFFGELNLHFHLFYIRNQSNRLLEVFSSFLFFHF